MTSRSPQTLVSWVGKTDLLASLGMAEGHGSVANAVEARPWNRVALCIVSCIKRGEWSPVGHRSDVHPATLKLEARSLRR